MMAVSHADMNLSGSVGTSPEETTPFWLFLKPGAGIRLVLPRSMSKSAAGMPAVDLRPRLPDRHPQ